MRTAALLALEADRKFGSHIFDPANNGALLWQLELGATVDSYPALTADGTLVVGVTDGRLLAAAVVAEENLNGNSVGFPGEAASPFGRSARKPRAPMKLSAGSAAGR